MARLERVYPPMFAEIHDQLLVLLDRDRPREEWRRIFDPGWERDEDHVGLALYDGDEPVAFVGLLFCEREVGGIRRRFCNVSSFVAKEPYRQEAALLALALRRMEGYTITNLSPNDDVLELFERLGFEELDTHWTIFRPTRLLRPSAWRRDVRVSEDADRLEAALGEAEARLLEDHRDCARHVIAEYPGGHCYVVYTTGLRWHVRIVRIHYLSHEEGFLRSLPRLQLHWLTRHGALLAECDERMLEGPAPPASFRHPRVWPRLYRSRELDRGRIDNLYSEVVLLNLE